MISAVHAGLHTSDGLVSRWYTFTWDHAAVQDCSPSGCMLVLLPTVCKDVAPFKPIWDANACHIDFDSKLDMHKGQTMCTHPR